MNTREAITLLTENICEIIRKEFPKLPVRSTTTRNRGLIWFKYPCDILDTRITISENDVEISTENIRDHRKNELLVYPLGDPDLYEIIIKYVNNVYLRSLEKLEHAHEELLQDIKFDISTLKEKYENYNSK